MGNLMLKMKRFFAVTLLMSLITVWFLPSTVYATPDEYPTKAQMKKKYNWEIKKPKMKPLVFDIDYDNYDLKFTDVPKNSEYRNAIIWAVENGIIENERKKFRPNDTMIVKELLDYLYHLRVKYHYNKFDALHNYNLLKYTKFVDIEEDEEHFLMHVYIIGNSPIYSYRSVDTGGSIYLEHGRYLPNLKVNRFCMLWISSWAKNSGLSMRVKDEEIGAVVSDPLSYNIHTLEPHNLKILRSFPDKKTNKLMTKKKVGQYIQSNIPYAVRYTLATGIPQLQRAGMLPIKFTYRDLDLRRLYSRAEAFQFIFEYCSKFKGDGKPGSDFRTQKTFF